MKKQFYSGIRNPLAGHGAKFNYEVLDLSEVKNVTCFDGEKDIKEAQHQILIGTHTGGSKSMDKIIGVR